MQAGTTNRGGFGSTAGFVLAAAGSAVGLGNIWRFPYMAGGNGGAAFIAVYLFWVVVLCLPLLLAELSIGRATRLNPVGAFRKLAPGSAWPVLGGLGVLTGFIILSFYTVVAGWTLQYLVLAVSGRFTHGMTAEESAALFGSIAGSQALSIGLAVAFLVLTALVVVGGVHRGIERASKTLMPALFLLLVALMIRSTTLPGAGEGIRFLLHADFSQLTPKVILAALGQALFSLSLGMGAMITYGSYLSGKERLPGAAVVVAISDTVVALLAGFVIFPALFSTGGSPEGGPGLVFHVLPTIFVRLPAGFFFATAFYALLVIAALTSTISLLEVVVSYFVDQRGWPRVAATWAITAACAGLAVFSAVSGSFLDWLNILFGNFALTIGAFFIAVFVGWRWGTGPAVRELSGGGDNFPLSRVWGVLIRYLCPLAILVIIGFLLYTREFF